MFIAISTLVILIVSLGLINRHNRKVHIPLMSTAFAIDLTLVLIIEFQRQAIENVIVSQSQFVWFHVTVSTLVLVCYIVLAYTGVKMSKLAAGPAFYETQLVKIHRMATVSFIVLRLTNYVTSFFMPVNI